jgi:threonine dehydrogenase-like Zn-dependent dehydrogenase
MMEKAITVRGGQSPTQRYWQMCLDKIQSGEMDPTFIVTHHANLNDAPKIYQDFDDKDGVIKVLLRP